MSTKRGGILIISGISGAGKTTLAQLLCKLYPDYVQSRSTTTRNMRRGEQDGVDYDFVTEDEFSRLISSGVFLEYAGVHGKRYGTRFSLVLEAIGAGKTVVLAIDVQGNQLIRQSDDPRLNGVHITSVFISVDLQEARLRLEDRGNMTSDQIDARMREAKNEIARIREFDHVIENPPSNIAQGFENLKKVLGLE